MITICFHFLPYIDNRFVWLKKHFLCVCVCVFCRQCGLYTYTVGVLVLYMKLFLFVIASRDWTLVFVSFLKRHHYLLSINRHNGIEIAVQLDH